MPLVTQKKPNLSGGVNQQGAVHRLSTQVEEMDNCIPTLDQGTRLRNPTSQVVVYNVDGNPSEISLPSANKDAFIYEYDRGEFKNRASKLVFMITEEGQLEIVDLAIRTFTSAGGQEVTGAVAYRDGNGLNYPVDAEAKANAKAYFANYGGRNSFAMTTVKDTTFVVNKNVAPTHLPTKFDSANPTFDYGDVHVATDGTPTGLNPETVVAGVFTVPTNTLEVNRSLHAGGGGAGGGESGESWTNDGDGNGGDGGLAGDEIIDSIAVAETQAYSVATGAGGTGGAGGARGSYNDGYAGIIGGNTTFGIGTPHEKTLIGGTGGAGGTGHGDPQYGTNGESSLIGTGGIGGSGDGVTGTGGGLAAGGGGGSGGHNNTTGDGEKGGDGGAGGIGKLTLSWNNVSVESTQYKRAGYVWIKSADVVNTGYGYGCTIRILKSDGITIEELSTGLTVPATTGSIVAAEALAILIEGLLLTRANVSARGSLIQVLMSPPVAGLYEEILSIDCYDTFGDLASYGWGHRVEDSSELPKNMGDFNPVVQVGKQDKNSYWLQYHTGAWNEYRDPDEYTTLDPRTMPHTITKKFNVDTQRYEFYVEQFPYNRRRVGDEHTNKMPSFVNPIDEIPTTYIKDLFFFRNRLGFITSTSIIMSEVGEYGNFFRTSVAALLDGDRIDAGVESLNAVDLEYAVLIDDSVILFGDKAQFRFSGGDILSPAAHKIQQELAYDINNEVRPLFMNDRIFFVANRGKYSAIYEMVVSNNSGQNSSARDLTAHCQSYVDGIVEKLTGSAVHNMLFVNSLVDYNIEGGGIGRNSVFVYKYHEDGRQKMQEAWFKWTFNGDIVSAFAVSDNFYLMIHRRYNIVQEDWTVGTGQWRMDLPWRMAGQWLMSPKDLEVQPYFEVMPIYPKKESGVFLDNTGTEIDGLIELGEFVYGKDGNKDTRGTTKMKTIEVEASEESEFKLSIEDLNRNTYREVRSKMIKRRKPMIYGDSKNVRVGIKNQGITGFRIEMVSYEVNINKRAKSH